MSSSSQPNFLSTLRSTDYDLLAGVRFLEDFARNASSRRNPHYGARDGDNGRVFEPRFDLEQHDTTFELYGELPGFDSESLIVEAHDDRNIQISGWMPRKAHGCEGGEEGVGAHGSVRVRHDSQKPAPAEHNIDRFGSVLDPHRSPPPPKVSHALDPAALTQTLPPAADASATTTAPTPAPAAEPEPETARFGDTLDSHATFVHRPAQTPSTKPKHHDQPRCRMRLLISERQFGQFHRTFHFPVAISKDKVVARLDGGILHVTVPRAEVVDGGSTRVKIHDGSAHGHKHESLEDEPYGERLWERDHEGQNGGGSEQKDPYAADRMQSGHLDHGKVF